MNITKTIGIWTQPFNLSFKAVIHYTTRTFWNVTRNQPIIRKYLLSDDRPLLALLLETLNVYIQISLKIMFFCNFHTSKNISFIVVYSMLFFKNSSWYILWWNCIIEKVYAPLSLNIKSCTIKTYWFSRILSKFNINTIASIYFYRNNILIIKMIVYAKHIGKYSIQPTSQNLSHILSLEQLFFYSVKCQFARSMYLFF